MEVDSAVNSATSKDICHAGTAVESNIDTVAVTNLQDQSCDAVALDRDPSACVFFQIGEDFE